MKRRNYSPAVIILAAVAEEAFVERARLEKSSPYSKQVEEASRVVDAVTLALSRLPATTEKARVAKARVARLVFTPEPTAEGVGSYVERAFAASIVRDAIATSANRRSAA